MHVECLVAEGKLIPLGTRRIVRMGKVERYLIYLPERLNSLWKYLNSEGAKVEVYIRIQK